MTALRKVPEGSKIGPAIYKPEERQCWFCLHNKVSDLCSACLTSTELYEASDGKLGKLKPAWEYDIVDRRWKKDEE